MDRGSTGGGKLSGSTVLVIADICAAYWLARAGTLSTTLAAVLAAVAFAVILIVRGTVKSRKRRQLRERQEMLGRLAGDLRAVTDRHRARVLSGEASARTCPRLNRNVEHDRDHRSARSLLLRQRMVTRPRLRHHPA